MALLIFDIPGSLMTTCVLCLLAISVTQASGSCQLPDSWRGSWFQAGHPVIQINSSAISVKGRCLESDGDSRFLFEDTRDNCYRCLFIVHQKHPNVLQYKETFCEERDSLANLCSLIPGDAQLHSMFRRDAQPVECPFRGSFTFTYSRGHGECRSPVSRLDSCTEPWRLFFRYQACPDIQGTESSEEQLECLAVWKEGSTRYMVGRLEHQGATSDEDRYRCFVYERAPTGSTASRDSQRSVVLLAQSGDATCSGLTTATEGSRTLRLTKAEVDGRKCRYPAWLLAHPHWQTLDGRWMYSLHKNVTLRITNSSAAAGYNSASAGDRHEQRATCNSVLDMDAATARVVAHISRGCNTGYVCMVFYQRDTHVVEYQAGDVSPAPEEACTPNYFNPVPGHYTTLISASHQSMACPLDGKFAVLGQPEHVRSIKRPCDGTINDLSSLGSPSSSLFNGDHRQGMISIASGCSSPDALDFYNECSRDNSAGYICRSTWTDDHDPSTKFVIVTPLHRASHHNSARRFCLTMKNLHQGVGSWRENGGNLWEWITSSETCIRPYARDRTAQHGHYPGFTYNSHNSHHLQLLPDSVSPSSGNHFNVTAVGQCTGIEAPIRDSRVVQSSTNSPAVRTAPSALLMLLVLWLLVQRWR